jgi:hypothetical protein
MNGRFSDVALVQTLATDYSRSKNFTLYRNSLAPRNKPLKMTSRILNIHECCSSVHISTTYNHHNVRVRRKRIDKGGELAIGNFHSLKLGLSFFAR